MGIGGSGGQTTNYFGSTGQGGGTVWDTTTTTWSDKGDGTGTPNLTWNATLPTRFGGTAGTVTVSPVAPQAGIYFDSTGYTLNSGTITLTTVPTISVVNVGETATINSQLSGTAGLTKSGAGTLVLGNTGNDFTGTVTVGGGVLTVSDDAHLGNSANGVALSSGTLQATASITTARGFTGTGILDIAPATTLTSTGTFATSGVTLNNTGILALNGVTPSVGSVTFNAATTIQNNSGTALPVTGITTTHTTGTATVTGPIALTGTVNVTVADGSAATDLDLPGNLSGAATLNKTGAGTLSLTGDNSGLIGAGTTPASIRQGTAGTTPVSGGVIAFNNANALGTGQLQLNGGTLRNDSGSLLTINFVGNSISTGAQDHVNTPGGLVFSGADLTFSGNLALYRPTGATYQHAVTVNNITTVGGLGAPTGTGTSTGLTVAGTGTLIVNGDASLMTLPITINSGATLITAPGVTLGSAVTLNNGGSFGTQTNVAAGNYNTYANQTSPAGLASVLALLDGTATGGVVTSTWTARGLEGGDIATQGTALAPGIHNMISDIVDFTGTGSDIFVMQIGYDETQILNLGTYGENNVVTDGFLYLAYNNGSLFVNGILGNTGNNATGAQQRFLGSFADFQLANGTTLSNYVGAYGVDTTINTAWAVVNHNSQWAVVPEPGTLALLAFGSLAVMRFRRKNNVTKS